MPKSLEETVMFTNEDEGSQDLFDRLLAYRSTKQSVKMSEFRKQSRRDDKMDVDALSKGRTKGKGKKGPDGSGNGNKDQTHVSAVKCWKCGRTGHYGRDCREKWSGDKGNAKSRESKGIQGEKGKGKSKGKNKGNLNSVEQQLVRAC